MTQIEILTGDTAWAAKHGKPGRKGRTVVTVADVEPVRFAGVDMVRFDLRSVTRQLPCDWKNRWTMVPATYVVQ